MSESQKKRAKVQLKSELRCPFCHGAIQGEESKWACVDCMAWHHDDCHREHGRCASCGARPTRRDGVARQTPKREQGRDLICEKPGCWREALRLRGLDRSISRYCVEHGRKNASDMGRLGAQIVFLAVLVILIVLGYVLVIGSDSALLGLLYPVGGIVVGLAMMGSKWRYERVAAEHERERESEPGADSEPDPPAGKVFITRKDAAAGPEPSSPGSKNPESTDERPLVPRRNSRIKED